MSRDKRYQRLLNDKRWWGDGGVKVQVWRRANGLCEECAKQGIVTPGVDVHHIRPVEQAKTVQEMERLAYNPANCQLLCIPCHIKVHQEMRTHTKEKVAENKARARQRFMEANDPNWGTHQGQLEPETNESGTQPPEQPKPYGQQADEYIKNLEERARLETLND